MDRRWMIFGNAVLFSALGCELGEGDPIPDAEMQVRDSRVEPDVEAADAAPDLAAVDMAPEVDVGPVLDMSFEPDAAVEIDAMIEPDMASEPDMAVELDMAPEPDMTLDPDMAIVPDLGPPEPDMAPPAMCADLIGQGCQINNEGCCPDGQNPEAVCWGDANGRMVWQSIPGDFFCNCIQDPNQTTFEVICAVPGFVGVGRAGRRLRGPRLRDLLAA